MVGEMNNAVSPVDFDRMLNGLDRIYSEFARACGLSDCAEGSRKNKVVCLTEEGRRFAERYALPAQKAEQQAFEALEPWEQREIMRLVGKFSHVLNEECEAFKRQVAAENEADDKGEGETCDS